MPIALVTGANGYVGAALCQRLIKEGWDVRASVRAGSLVESLPRSVKVFRTADLGIETNWAECLSGVEVVFHLAARVHVFESAGSESRAAFMRANSEGTRALAAAARLAGVRRFVFLSSIGVNGSSNQKGQAFCEESMTLPGTDYTRSKKDAEEALRQECRNSPMQSVVIRSPMIYGPFAPGNFDRLVKVVRAGYPLPFRAVSNQRSFIYISNLVDALVLCASHSAAANRLFLVSDLDSLSTPDLIRLVARGLGVTVRLFSVPCSIMQLAGSLTGRSDSVDRLLGSLLVDCSRIRGELGWTPPFSAHEGVVLSAAAYK